MPPPEQALPEPQAEEAPQAQAAPPVLYQKDSGKAVIADPDGSVSLVAAQDLDAALATGSRPATAAEYRAAKGGALDTIGAAVVGAARGASFGLSDPLYIEGARKLYGDAAAEEVRGALNEYRDQHGTATVVGEIGGSLLPLAFGAPPGEAAVTAESVLGRAAQRALMAAPRAMLEGGAIGLGQQLSEDALGNHAFVAEKYVMAGLQGGLLGVLLSGAGAAGIGAAGDTLSGVLARAESGTSSLALRLAGVGDEAASTVQRGGDALAAKARGISGEAVEALAERQFGYAAPGLGEKIRQRLVSASAGASGRDRGVIERLTAMDAAGREARRIAVFDAEKELETVQREFRAAGDDMLRANRRSMQEFQGELKAEKIASAVKRGNEAEVTAYARKQLAHVIEMAEAELRHEGGVAPQAIKSLEGIARAAYHADAEITAALERGGSANETAFIQLDRVKRDVQRWVNGGYQGVMRIADPFESRLAMRSVQALDSLQNTMRRGLEDEGLWGKAGSIQAAINSEWTKQIDAAGRFNKALTTEVGRDPTNPFLKIRGLDPSKVETYARGLLNPNGDLTHQAVKDYVSSTEKLAQVLRENVALPPDKLAEVDTIVRSAKRFQAATEKAEKTLTLVNQYKSLAGSDGFGTVAAMVGGALGGPVGSALAAGLGTLANPQRAVAQLASLERMAIRVDEKIGGAVRSFLEGGKRAADRAGGAAEGAVTKVTAETVRQLREATSSPQALADMVARAVAPLRESAPSVAQAASTTLMRAAMYIGNQLPPEPAPRGVAWTEQKPRQLGAQQATRIERSLQGADFESIMNSLAKGRVNRDAIEAFKHIYPESYARVQQEIRRLGPELRPSMSVQQEMAMSILFDTPVSALTKPSTIKGFQSAFAAEPASQPSSGAQPMSPSRPLGKTGDASLATATDRLESAA